MDELISHLIDLAIAIQQIPAPTFHEAERAEFVRARFAEAGLQDVEIDSVGNVYACLRSLHAPQSALQAPSSTVQAPPSTVHAPRSTVHGPQSIVHRPLVVSAHLDTVFPPETDLRCERRADRILGPGIGDNSLGVAGLIGLVWMLRERKIALPGDLWLAANVCEEGLGNLRGMKAVVERFGADPLAYLVVEGMALGLVYQRGLGACRYRVAIHTPGGHSWHDYGQPSAVHELAALSTRLTSLELPRLPRTTLNIGVLSGGSSVNTIAAEAMLELDLRSEGPQALAALAGQVEQIVRSAEKPGVTVTLEDIGQRPSGELPADHPLVQAALGSLRSLGIEPRLNIGSTDANLPLSRGFPSVTVGLTTGGGGHTTHEYMHVAPLEKGMEQLVRLVSGMWDALEK